MTIKPIKILASDLDGTLFYDGKVSNGKMGVENLEAIRRWIAKGNHFVIATGRPSRYLNYFQRDYQVQADIIGCDVMGLR